MEYARTDEEFLKLRADFYITDDGKNGETVDTVNNGGIPVFLTHRTSLFSNGRETGLRVLEIIIQRLMKHYGDRIEFVTFDALSEMTLNKEI